PAAPAMAGRIPAEPPIEPFEEEPFIAATLDPAKIALHPRRPPRCVAGHLPDVIPVGIVRPDDDHRVVAGASAKPARTRVEDAVDGFAIPLGAIAPVLALLRRIGVVADPEIPSKPRVFGRKGMKGGNAVIRADRPLLRRRVVRGLDGIVAGVEQEDASARF